MSAGVILLFCTYIQFLYFVHSSEILNSAINDLEKQLRVTNTRLKEMEETISHFKEMKETVSHCKEMEKTVHRLEEENSFLREYTRKADSKYAALEMKLGAVEKSVTHLWQISNVEADEYVITSNSTYNTKQNVLKTRMHQQTERVEETKPNLSRRGLESKIAFTVQNSNDIGHLGIGQTIVFDSVLTNIGDCYNHNTGIFTATVTGIYAFFYDIRTMGNQHLWVALVKDGSTLIQSYTVAPSLKFYHRAESNFAIVHLNQRDSIWIKTVHIASSNGAVDDHSSFSGFLLYSDE